MCTVGDDDIEELEKALKYMPEKPSTSLSRDQKCNKCKEASPCVLLRHKDRYCRGCFLAGAVHKFKALLGKHKLIRPDDRVMVVHRGGHPSTAMLHLIRTGLDLNTHKKLRFEPVLLFIEDQLHLPTQERINLAKSIDEEARRFGFVPHFASVASLLSTDGLGEAVVADPGLLRLSDEDKNEMVEFLGKRNSKTTREELKKVVTRQFLVDLAKHHNCKFVFTPEISGDVAAYLLTNVSLGRGAHVPLDTGFCDSRDDQVKILRPMRLFDAKELVFYNHFNGLEPVTYRQPKENLYGSVQSLMKKFVNDLQVNYPATVTTVLKTGDKLAVDASTGAKCELCKAPLVKPAHRLTSAESTNFSHWVSMHKPDHSLPPQERFEKALEGFDNETSERYCFSCSKFQEFIIK